MRHVLRVIFAFTVSLLIAACGGGDSLEGGGGGGGGGTNPTTVALNISDSMITAANPATLSATVTDNDGAMSGKVVTFSLDNEELGTFDPDLGTALTGTDGVATIQLRTNNIAGAGMATATVDTGEASSIGFTMAGDAQGAGNVATLELVLITNTTCGGANECAPVSNAASGILRATLLAPSGDPMGQQVIDFTSSLSPLSPTSSTALTNNNGQAFITLLAGQQPGAGIASATFTGATDLASAAIGYQTLGDTPSGSDFDDALLSLDLFSSLVRDGNGRPTLTPDGSINGTPTAMVSAASPASVIVKLTDTNGAPLTEQLATFSTTIGTINPLSQTALTDSNGLAVVELKAGAIPGAGSISVNFAGNSASHAFETLGDEGESTDISLDVEIVDQNNSQVTAANPITVSNPGQIRITATNSAGAPLANRLMTVTNESGVGVLSPLSGTALTDSQGLAVIGLLAGTTQGAGMVTVSLDFSNVNAAFQVGAANLKMGYCESDDPADGVPDDCSGMNLVKDKLGLSVGLNDKLSAGGTATVTAVIVDDLDQPFGTPVDVQFTSTCAAAEPPLAFIDEVKTTIDGLAVATYRADGCTADTITATADTSGIALVATANMEIAQADAASIEFLDASPSTIVLKGTGGSGRSETSVVRYRVRDTSGNPSSNQVVTFELTTEVGNLLLSSLTATTDAEGIAQVTVQSGTVSTVVRVKATLQNDITINTLSDQLVVSTGLPDQNSFSISAESINVDAWDTDGTQVPVTIRVADHFNNPVPDGTAINFTTEGGAIESECVTENGACSVMWTSQNARPVGLSVHSHNNLFCDEDNNPDNNVLQTPGNGVPCLTTTRSAEQSGVNGNRAAFKGGMGQPYGGRATILATAVGEESFIDTNGNGLYDSGEPFTDLTEAFRDDNEDNVFGGKELDDATPSPGASSADTAHHECYLPFDNFVCYDSGMGDLDLTGSGTLLRDLLTAQDPFNAPELLRQAGGNDEEFDDFLQENNGGNQELFDFENVNDADGDADGGDGIYNGTLCSDTAEAAGDCTKNTINVRASLVLLMADEVSAIRFTDTAKVDLLQVDISSGINGVSSQNIVIWYSDLHNGLPPVGTTISVSTTNGVLNGATSFVVANSNQVGPGFVIVNVGRESSPNMLNAGVMTATFTTPAGIISSAALTILDDG